MKKGETTSLPTGRKKAALYDPYLDVMGGGEKHILSILQVLEHKGFEVSVFWDWDLRHLILHKLNLHFENLKVLPNIFQTSSFIEKLQSLKEYDILLYVTDGSYFLSTAKKNVIFCMVPNKELYRMTLLNRFKTLNATYVSNSSYTKSWLEKWGVRSKVIYPYISDDLFDVQSHKTKKNNIILSVGRFFPHLHAKKHHELIKAFAMLRETHPEFSLVMAGGIKEEDKGYLEELKSSVGKIKNIIIEPNVPYKKLLDLYRKARIFWHFAGYGIDEDENPHMVEHLGMTPLEAMASSTPTFCFSAGGPKEIIKDGENGYLFETKEELIRKTINLLHDEKKYQSVQTQAREYVKQNFSFPVFKKRVEEVLL